MVSRRETARALLTPGEIMQLPPDDQIILVSGAAPIRAQKVRYFGDAQLKARIQSPPDVADMRVPAQHFPILVSSYEIELFNCETRLEQARGCPEMQMQWKSRYLLVNGPDMSVHRPILPGFWARSSLADQVGWHSCRAP